MHFGSTEKKYLIVLLIVSAVVVLLYFVVKKNQPHQVAERSDFEAAIDDTESVYLDLQGRVVSLETYRGKPLVVNTWATWSPFSVTEIKNLIVVAEEFSDDITILAINRKEPLHKIRSYIEQFTHADKISFLIDKNDSFYQSIEGFSVPETVFYDSTGNMIRHKRGKISIVELRKIVSDIIRKESASGQ